MFGHQFIHDRVEEIFSWYKTIFKLDSGLPASYVDGKTGRIIDQNPLTADLGDYLPFFAYFFRESKEKQKYCRQQLKLAKVEVNRNRLAHNFWGLKLIHAFEYSDFLFGLYLYHFLTHETEAKILAKEIVEKQVRPNFLQGSYCSFYLPQLRLRLPVVDSLLGSFIEILSLLAKTFPAKKEAWLEEAQKLAEFFAKETFFRTYKLFPHHLSSPLPFLIKDNQITMMKQNTNLVWGLLEFYRQRKVVSVRKWLKEWVKGVRLVRVPAGYVAQKVKSQQGRFKVEEVTLAANFAVIDLLCDIAFFLGEEESLQLAQAIADSWLVLQSQTTGLLPFQPNQRASFLDSETDMAIALLKLAELTERSKYAAAAQQIARGVLKHHYQPFGYALAVDINTGKMINPVVNVKFNALLIKLFLPQLEGSKIYKNPLLFELLKDR